MRKLKTTMLFLVISVTSFAQNFEGMEYIPLEENKDLFITSTKKISDAIDMSMTILDNNNVDTNSVLVDKESKVPIFLYWDDDKDDDKVYLFFLNNKHNVYNIAVIHQKKIYTTFNNLDTKKYIYDPK